MINGDAGTMVTVGRNEIGQSSMSLEEYLQPGDTVAIHPSDLVKRGRLETDEVDRNRLRLC